MNNKELYTLYKLASDFAPDYTPEELREMGVYDQVYGDAESEASMKKWPEHWVHPQDPLGWLQWYERYHGGRRTDDDDRQKKRWNSFKGRHGSQYLSKPTDRRRAALRNWAIAADKLKKQASTTDIADLWDEDSGEFYPVHVPNIWEQVAGRDSEEIDIDKIWGGLETSPGFSEDRVDASDTSYPIILDDYTEGEGFYGGLVDGRHRRIKMKRDGKTRASVIKLTPEDIRELIDRQKAETVEKKASAVDPSDAYAIYESTQGDPKHVFLRSQLTPDQISTLVVDDKDGTRKPGENYKGINILGDYYSHPTVKSEDGDNADIIVVDDEETARSQFDEYLMGGTRHLVDMKINSPKDHLKRKAVIIKGNPKFVEGSQKKLAEPFYNELKELLESKGYETSFDSGEPHTTPEAADLWVGHSRGQDRLKFAPEGTRTLAIDQYEDRAAERREENAKAMAAAGYANWKDYVEATGWAPPEEHYQVTDALREALA